MLILKIGLEGGNLTLVRNAEGDNWSFQLVRDESTACGLLSEEDRAGIVPRSVIDLGTSLAEALETLGRRYRWHRFYPLEIHPEFRHAILEEVEKRGGEDCRRSWEGELAGI